VSRKPGRSGRSWNFIVRIGPDKKIGEEGEMMEYAMTSQNQVVTIA
jgi:hypothetical protein